MRGFVKSYPVSFLYYLLQTTALSLGDPFMFELVYPKDNPRVDTTYASTFVNSRLECAKLCNDDDRRCTGIDIVKQIDGAAGVTSRVCHIKEYRVVGMTSQDGMTNKAEPVMITPTTTMSTFTTTMSTSTPTTMSTSTPTTMSTSTPTTMSTSTPTTMSTSTTTTMSTSTPTTMSTSTPTTMSTSTTTTMSTSTNTTMSTSTNTTNTTNITQCTAESVPRLKDGIFHGIMDTDEGLATLYDCSATGPYMTNIAILHDGEWPQLSSPCADALCKQTGLAGTLIKIVKAKAHTISAQVFCRSDERKVGDATCDASGRWKFPGKLKVGCIPTTCYRSTVGKAVYGGKVAESKYGIPCQVWDKQNPRTHDKKSSMFSVDHGNRTAAMNYCRDPDNFKLPWCYQMTGKRWSTCGIPLCRLVPIPIGSVFKGIMDTDEGLAALYDCSVTFPYMTDVAILHDGQWPQLSSPCADTLCKQTGLAGTLIKIVKAKAHTISAQVFCRSDERKVGDATCDASGRWKFPGELKVGCIPTMCYRSTVGKAVYGGKVAESKYGIPCQVWDKQYPRTHDKKSSMFSVDHGNRTAAMNYCRDPDNSKLPWCYQMAGKRRSTCGIPQCLFAPNIRNGILQGIMDTDNGVAYLIDCSARVPDMSNIAILQHGEWSQLSSSPCADTLCTQMGLAGTLVNIVQLNDRTFSAQVFCQSNERKVSDATCDVSSGTWTIPTVGCISTTCYRNVANRKANAMYEGKMAKSKNDITCQYWNKQTPHKHGQSKNRFVEENGNITAAKNYCRDPDGFTVPWCYQIKGKRFAQCDIPRCRLNL